MNAALTFWTQFWWIEWKMANTCNCWWRTKCSYVEPCTVQTSIRWATSVLQNRPRSSKVKFITFCPLSSYIYFGIVQTFIAAMLSYMVVVKTTWFILSSLACNYEFFLSNFTILHDIIDLYDYLGFSVITFSSVLFLPTIMSLLEIS